MRPGYLKTAVAVPHIRVADPNYNASVIIEKMQAAQKEGAELLLFPELCITGSTCGDLYKQSILLKGAMKALERIVKESENSSMLTFVGLPLESRGKVYSVTALVQEGSVLGLVPRVYTEGTVFAAPPADAITVNIFEDDVAVMGADILFECDNIENLRIGVLTGMSDTVDTGLAASLTAGGATVLVETSTLHMTVSSKRDKEVLLKGDSARLNCGIVYAAPGYGESTTDRVYSGLSAVAECGELVYSAEQGTGLALTEIDLDYIAHKRRNSDYAFEGDRDLRTVYFNLVESEADISRVYGKLPFLPCDERDIDDYCARALEIQALGLVKRMTYTGLKRPVIGVSGGLDSALVLLACARALDIMGEPRSNIVGITMPCFGTTDRTKNNAIIIAEELGTTLRIIPIGDTVMKHFESIGHDYENKNIVFENAQARERTMVLLDVANAVGGLDVGTKDLSEQADGWCTFNGDQISNYDINAGVTKSMVRLMVRHYAERCENKKLGEALLDICNTPVTPELLPLRNGELVQKSEDSVGPYDLQDFYLWHMLIRGGTPERLLYLAERSYGDEYDKETLKKWLNSYCERLFSQQFKRSTTADGPDAVGFTFSPRAGFKMPSDACSELWLSDISAL